MCETNLILGLLGMPPESARNCTQEISPIHNGEFRETVNGEPIFLKSSDKRRYKTTIICKDLNSPLVDKIWIGSQINVGCIQNLWQAIDIGKTEITLVRPPVKNSIGAINEEGVPVRFTFFDSNNTVTIAEPKNTRIFVYFRPWLTMYVTNFRLETNEWGMSGGWRLDMEEI